MPGTICVRHSSKRSAQKPPVQRASPGASGSTLANGLGPPAKTALAAIQNSEAQTSRLEIFRVISCVTWFLKSFSKARTTLLQLHRLRHDTENHKTAIAYKFQFLPSRFVAKCMNIDTWASLDGCCIFQNCFYAATFVRLCGKLQLRHLQPHVTRVFEITHQYLHRFARFKFNRFAMFFFCQLM